MKIQTNVELILVTPKMAAEWLSNSWGDQRSIRPRQVDRLAADMEQGRWRVGSDAILLVNGKLANGQHRLSAVVKSGTSQTFLVFQSNDDQLYKVLDSGMRRTASDGLIGMVHAKTVPSVARWVLAYEHDSLTKHSDTGVSLGASSRYQISQSELIDYCKDNAEMLTEAVRIVCPMYEESHLVPLSVGSALYVLASNLGLRDTVEEFLNGVYKGGNTQSAAGMIRKRLIKQAKQKAKIPNSYLFGIMLKGFSCYRKGESCGVIRWGEKEGMPTI